MESTSVRPLLSRLEHSSRIVREEGELQPVLGASVVVDTDSGQPKTVWLPAEAWRGIASIIRQTPYQHRAGVAMFLGVLASCIDIDSEPLTELLEEVIREVEHDPYTDMAETDRHSFDFMWT